MLIFLFYGIIILPHNSDKMTIASMSRKRFCEYMSFNCSIENEKNRNRLDELEKKIETDTCFVVKSDTLRVETKPIIVRDTINTKVETEKAKKKTIKNKKIISYFLQDMIFFYLCRNFKLKHHEENNLFSIFIISYDKHKCLFARNNRSKRNKRM